MIVHIHVAGANTPLWFFMIKCTVRHPITLIHGDAEGEVLLQRTLEALGRFITCTFVDFDLSLENRLETEDGVTRDAAAHLHTNKVGLKAPTTTQGAEARGPKLKSPNITLRAGLGGVAIVREANLIPGVVAPNRNLKGPITVIRKATEGIYEAMEWRSEDHSMVYRQEHMSIGKMEALARFAVDYALENRTVLWSATKHTISRIFEGTLQKVIDDTAGAASVTRGLQYQPMLIDAAYQALMHPPERLTLVCDNFNGDCLGDLVPAMYGSVAGCGSILVGEDGARMFDPPHGTAPSLLGKDTANPLATIIAATGAFAYAARRESNGAAVDIAERFKAAAFETIGAGTATFDLAAPGKAVGTRAFLDAVIARV